jgi:hypothetical protein
MVEHNSTTENKNKKGTGVSAEYKELVDTVFGRGTSGRDRAGSGTDAYQTLMAKERRVLDTVDRVVNDAAVVDADTRTFFQMPMHEIAIRIVRSIRGLMDDLVEARKPEHVLRAVMREDRKVYLGLVMIAVALCIALIHASSSS